MFQNFLMKTMLKRQMKDVPEEQQEMIFSAIEKNPDFFMTIANEIQEKVKGGMSQQDAMMAVMQTHGEQMKSIMGK